MKKIVTLIIIVSMLFCSTIGSAASTGLWEKHTQDDGNFSFYYPSGWKVGLTESAVIINGENTNEQLIMVMIPYDKDKNPTDLAKDFLVMMNNNNSNLKASNWQMNLGASNGQASFDLTDVIGEKQYKGSGIVIKDSQQAIWFSYIGPTIGYSRDRGLGLLQGFIGSIASGSNSENPKVIYDHSLTTKIDTNAKGFMFVLEFALGAPFTASQERIILDELKSGWRLYSEEELSVYDQYPLIAKRILTMDQNSLNELRIELEGAIIQWLDENSDSDKAVIVINEQLRTRGKEAIVGNPPLTEMSLTAYSEIIAFSRLLKQDSKATLEQISQDSVKEIKEQVKYSWSSLTTKEQEQIASSPGLWVCLRTLINNGSINEQKTIRDSLIKLTPDRQTSKDNTISENPQSINNNGASVNKSKPMDMTSHNVMLNMNNMTFNSYRWSRGFK